MGGSQSHEFMVASDAGEDFVAHLRQVRLLGESGKGRLACPSRPASRIRKATAPEEFHTPGRKTIAEVAEFTGLPETSQMKSLVMVADGKPVLALLRGDHQLSETKFAAVAGRSGIPPGASATRSGNGSAPRPARSARSASTNMPILADQALAGPPQHDRRRERGRPSPAQRHAGRGFPGRVHDLRQVAAGDTLRELRRSRSRFAKTVEIGHIFKLGYKYSESMGLRVLNADGKEVTPIMGSYGIGIERILCAAIELYHDKDGMILPPSIAPFEVVVTPANNADAAQKEAAREIYRSCLALGSTRCWTTATSGPA